MDHDQSCPPRCAGWTSSAGTSHTRDPHQRIDALHSSRRVQVFVAGQEVAHSVRPLVLFETSLPTRYYLPFSDVRTDLLEASDKVGDAR